MTTIANSWLEKISADLKPRPASIVGYGPPGIGKTSLAAAAPNPLFLIDSQENGINTLKSSGIVSRTIPVLPPVSNWQQVIDHLRSVVEEEHDRKYMAIDTLGGMERLCHEYICEKEFRGVWGEKGFTGYMRGFEVALPEWRKFLNLLDMLRTERHMGVIALAHSIVKPFKNPEGEDYDRFVVDIHPKTWAVTHKWADIILFANYYIEVDKDRSGKAKGKGGQMRFFNTEFHAAYDAKNRHNLPAAISMGSSGEEAWANLRAEITNARKGEK